MGTTANAARPMSQERESIALENQNQEAEHRFGVTGGSLVAVSFV